ncbi:TELO2-interacting protein 2-like [Limulus polyphemus]|uniref:TELO2-interacting protein 2-like n=1 Tax=Limulus polyphemus TaxID=6850 RepID=A0ABM1SNF4_LIMPO|nr:TELO2-interacting protein 2-like [Limulus polyphemus]
MEHEQMLDHRKIYSRHILSYIDKLGITVIRHIKHTLQVLLEYIIIDSGPDETARKNCLSALKKLITVAWPRIDSHCEDILKTLLRLLCDVTVDLQNSPNKAKEDLLELTVDCLHYLKRACSWKFKVAGHRQILKGLNLETNKKLGRLVLIVFNFLSNWTLDTFRGFAT